MSEKEERTLHIIQKIEGRFAGETHITRTEAIIRMAKALCSCQEDGCKNCYVKNNKEACLCVLVDGLYTRHAEAALNALLGESND